MGGLCLPLEILNQQVCQACSSYLSVGPVKVSSTGDVVCGRPNCSLFIKAESTHSLYNIVASAYLFKCTYHYSGCDQLLAFEKVNEHENQCSSAKVYECPFCYFKGNSCGLVCHFGKTHPTYLPREDVLGKILSYEDLSNNMHSILKMTKLELRQFIGHAPKIFLAICQNCNINIRKQEDVYFCTKYHTACNNCYQNKCTKCNTFQPWTKISVLDDVLFECEWTGCPERRSCFEYLWHKQTCSWRPYKCPFWSCDHTSFLKNLKIHWHLTLLAESNYIEIRPDKCLYWLPSLYQEIVFITFEVDSIGDGIVIMYNENNVLPVFFRLNIINMCGTKSPLKGYALDSLQKCDKMKYFKIEGFSTNFFSRVVLEARFK